MLDLQALSGWSPPGHLKADGEKRGYNSLYPVLFLLLACHCSPEAHDPCKSHSVEHEDGSPRSQWNVMTLVRAVHSKDHRYSHTTHPKTHLEREPTSFPDMKGQLAESGRARLRVSRQREQLKS